MDCCVFFDIYTLEYITIGLIVAVAGLAIGLIAVWKNK
jgi:hypothetical protein